MYISEGLINRPDRETCLATLPLLIRIQCHQSTLKSSLDIEGHGKHFLGSSSIRQGQGGPSCQSGLTFHPKPIHRGANQWKMNKCNQDARTKEPSVSFVSTLLGSTMLCNLTKSFRDWLHPIANPVKNLSRQTSLKMKQPYEHGFAHCFKLKTPKLGTPGHMHSC
jgi:hypothetical protein